MLLYLKPFFMDLYVPVQRILTRALLVSLLAWLPASLVQAAEMRVHAAQGCQMEMTQPDHAAMHGMHGQACQMDAQASHGGCHGCDLCSLSIASAPAVIGLNLPPATRYILPRQARVPAFTPEQPERPPRV